MPLFDRRRKKHQQKPQEEESDLTMDEFQKLVGKMLQASQEANWEQQRKQKKARKPETSEPA